MGYFRTDGFFRVILETMDSDVKLRDVGFRTVDMIDESMPMEDFWEMMQEYKNCVNFAHQTVLDSQEKN